MAGWTAMRTVSSLVALACVLAGLALGAAAPAQAAERTMSFRSGPFDLGGFETKTPKVWVRTPNVDGYLTFMDAVLEDARGRRISIRRVMLHHIVFLNKATTLARSRSSCGGRVMQPFWGTGEERQR